MKVKNQKYNVSYYKNPFFKEVLLYLLKNNVNSYKKINHLISYQTFYGINQIDKNNQKRGLCDTLIADKILYITKLKPLEFIINKNILLIKICSENPDILLGELKE